MEVFLAIGMGFLIGLIFGADCMIAKYKTSAEEHKAVEIGGKIYRMVEVRE